MAKKKPTKKKRPAKKQRLVSTYWLRFYWNVEWDTRWFKTREFDSEDDAKFAAQMLWMMGAVYVELVRTVRDHADWEQPEITSNIIAGWPQPVSIEKTSRSKS